MLPSTGWNKLGISALFLLALALTASSCSISRKGQKTTSHHDTRDSRLRNALIADAKKQLGIPYKYAGNTPRTGFDCSGFTCYVFNKHNIRLPRVSHEQARIGKKINYKFAKKGDLIFFGKNHKVNHVGIVTENKKGEIFVIHSTSSKGVVINNITQSKYWRRRILFARDVLAGGVLARK